MNLLALLSLLPGCGPKKPAGPGVSEPLQFLRLLVGQWQVVVKPEMQKLTTTTVAAGRQFSASQVTAFGKTSGVLHIGTSSFQVYLHLRPVGQPSVAQLKSLVKQTAIPPETVKYPGAAAREVDEAASLPQLIETGSTSWR